MKNVHKINSPYQCLRCLPKNVQYSTKNSLDRHIAKVHDKTLERKYLCLLCPLKFWTKQNLDRHQRVHDGKKPYPCPHCSARFTLPHSVKSHIKAVHLKQKDWHCQHCSKSFATKTTLKGHMSSVHNDATFARFKCNICDKQFYERQRFISHKKNYLLTYLLT